ncbi:MAG: hypothetical protein BWY52_00599 [Chloroflexi bacterium ADurb.Bin325]|nr:MAG: hypothetical protein BWY52_00599 [Chloroflexi bacterium ADurb.Bin325]
MDAQPARCAARAISRGAAGRPTTSCVWRGIWEISQFWQNAQRKLQPGVAIENAVVPGRKWNRGFFSMGSTCCAIVRA